MSPLNLELQRLSVDERINLIAQLCDSLDEDQSTSGQPTPAQRTELDRRLHLLEEDPTRALTWAQVLERIEARKQQHAPSVHS